MKYCDNCKAEKILATTMITSRTIVNDYDLKIDCFCATGVTTVGMVHCVTGACGTLAVTTEPAVNPGSAPVIRTGEACSVIKVRK